MNSPSLCDCTENGETLKSIRLYRSSKISEHFSASHFCRLALFLYSLERLSAIPADILTSLVSQMMVLQQGHIFKSVAASSLIGRSRHSAQRLICQYFSPHPSSNVFLDFCGWQDCKVKPIKGQGNSLKELIFSVISIIIIGIIWSLVVACRNVILVK